MLLLNKNNMEELIVKLVDQIISLNLEMAKLRVENKSLNEQLDHERTLNQFRNEFPGKL